jgi:hypothetical protein
LDFDHIDVNYSGVNLTSVNCVAVLEYRRLVQT